MDTQYYTVDPNEPDPSVINQAASLILQGEVVAFPTETVYGLGASALDEKAVGKIFAAKGRRPDNPLIVHVGSWDQAREMMQSIHDDIAGLVRLFWPGPLTIVALSQACVPEAVRAGLPSVAVRMPDHPVALALIRRAGVPLAAPSANRSGRPSPTSAQHVRQDLSGRIAAILDGGPTGLGIESTILDATARPYRILRPGAISWEELERALPDSILPWRDENTMLPDLAHYQPQARVIPAPFGANLRAALAELPPTARLGAVSLGNLKLPDLDFSIAIKGGPSEYGQRLYDIFRAADENGLDYLVMELPEETGLGTAVADRIKKAAER
jgi:L-threonylcarbamoyladenylate synthase